MKIIGEVTPKLTKRESLRIVEWVEYLLDELNEVDGNGLYMLHVIVRTLDDEQLRALLDKTDEVEASGGMLTLDKTRRRSKGGCLYGWRKKRMKPCESDFHCIIQRVKPRPDQSLYEQVFKNRRTIHRKSETDGNNRVEDCKPRE